MKRPLPGHIWFLEEPRLGDAQHGHYVLVTQVKEADGMVNINFIATDSTDYDDFSIQANAGGFGVTGLKHDCHLLRNHSYDISIAQLQSKGRYKGLLAGQLKKDIEEWWGETI